MKVNSVLPLIFVGVAGHGSLVMAQDPGTFTVTGSMITPRAGHTATLLVNGKVLIAGGFQRVLPDSVLVSAELYDPSTGTFTPTGSMTTPQTGHKATLLDNGKVLITGGKSAELYDPSTGAFTPTGAMTTLRDLHTATLLADGRVLVTGCANPCSNSAIAELYNPGAGVFIAVGTPRTGGVTATLLADGRVLTTGGGGCAGGSSAAAQLFDPGTGMFSFTGRMQSCEYLYTATLLTNGKVLFAGNPQNDGLPADAELYDPAAGTFARLGQTIGTHPDSAATLLPDGTVLITGGQVQGGNGGPGAELYTPTSGTFSLRGSMSSGRQAHTATLLPDGTVLIAGGFSVYPGATAAAEIYRPIVMIPAPVLYSQSGDGRGQGAILHPGTAKVASLDNPAAVGEALEIYLTGLMDGSVIPPQVSIGGRMAEVLYFGNTPGFAGLNQVNVRVPSGVAPGPAVPLRLNYLERSSNEVTISVR